MGGRAVSRTIWIPDYGASDSLYQPVQIPGPGEPGYISPADRIALADPNDPIPAIIAREQAIAEHLDCTAGAPPEPEAGS